MIGQPRPPGGLRSLAAWSLGIGLAWLLLGQQLAGQPVIQLDLTAGLPGAPSVYRQPHAPARPAPADLTAILNTAVNGNLNAESALMFVLSEVGPFSCSWAIQTVFAENPGHAAGSCRE